MKTRLTALLAITLGVFASLQAQPLSPSQDRQSLKIIQTVEPSFPLSVGATVMSGSTRIAISVDENGVLKNTLVVAYSQAPFARAALAAIKDWRFEPATLDGQPISVTCEVLFEFERTGVLAQVLGPEALSMKSFALLGSCCEFKPSSLAELDAPLTPISCPAPKYAAGMEKAGIKGSVTLTYYIDSEGRVQMPAILQADDIRLAELASETVKTWQYEKPTSRGEATIVQVVQPFVFTVASK